MHSEVMDFSSMDSEFISGLQREHRHWIEQNPLRTFRKHHQLSMMNAAALLDVNMTTIQQWESGSNRPNEENMQNLGRLLGVEQMCGLWDAWYNSKPRI